MPTAPTSQKHFELMVPELQRTLPLTALLCVSEPHLSNLFDEQWHDRIFGIKSIVPFDLGHPLESRPSISLRRTDSYPACYSCSGITRGPGTQVLETSKHRLFTIREGRSLSAGKLSLSGGKRSIDTLDVAQGRVSNFVPSTRGRWPIVSRFGSHLSFYM